MLASCSAVLCPGGGEVPPGARLHGEERGCSASVGPGRCRAVAVRASAYRCLRPIRCVGRTAPVPSASCTRARARTDLGRRKLDPLVAVAEGARRRRRRMTAPAQMVGPWLPHITAPCWGSLPYIGRKCLSHGIVSVSCLDPRSLDFPWPVSVSPVRSLPRRLQLRVQLRGGGQLRHEGVDPRWQGGRALPVSCPTAASRRAAAPHPPSRGRYGTSCG